MPSSIPDHAICFFRDGDKVCAVFGDFVNLQESPAGFGNNFSEAMEDLRRCQPHMHVNSGDGSDSCARCGKDLRNEIHFRASLSTGECDAKVTA